MHVEGKCRKWMDGRRTRRTQSDGTRTWFIIHWTKSYEKFQLNMSKHVREKCWKLCIFSITSSKKELLLQNLTQIDDTKTWSVVLWNKVICKISAQYIKACKRKVRKTVYFQYSKFHKGYNSYKIEANWRHSNLICSTVKQSHMKNLSSICQRM